MMKPTRTTVEAQSTYDFYIVPGDKVEYNLWLDTEVGKFDLTQCIVELEFSNLVQPVATYKSNQQTGVYIVDPKRGKLRIELTGAQSEKLQDGYKYRLSVIDKMGDRATLLLGRVVQLTGE